MKKILILVIFVNSIFTLQILSQNTLTLSGGILLPNGAYSGGDLKYAMFGSLYNGYAYKKMGYDINLKYGYNLGKVFRVFLKANYNNAGNDYSENFGNGTGISVFKSKSEIWAGGAGIEYKFAGKVIIPYLLFGLDVNYINFRYSADNPPPGALSGFQIYPDYRMGTNFGVGFDYPISKDFQLNLELVYNIYNLIGASANSPAFYNLNSRYLNDAKDADIPGDIRRYINGLKLTIGISYLFKEW